MIIGLVVVVVVVVVFGLVVDVDGGVVLESAVVAVVVGSGAEHWRHLVSAFSSAPCALAKASAHPGGRSPAGKHCA
jgi:hypothetical protein